MKYIATKRPLDQQTGNFFFQMVGNNGRVFGDVQLELDHDTLEVLGARDDLPPNTVRMLSRSVVQQPRPHRSTQGFSMYRDLLLKCIFQDSKGKQLQCSALRSGLLPSKDCDGDTVWVNKTLRSTYGSFAGVAVAF